MKTVALTEDEVKVLRWLCLKYAARIDVPAPDLPIAKRIEAALTAAGKLS